MRPVAVVVLLCVLIVILYKLGIAAGLIFVACWIGLRVHNGLVLALAVALPLMTFSWLDISMPYDPWYVLASITCAVLLLLWLRRLRYGRYGALLFIACTMTCFWLQFSFIELLFLGTTPLLDATANQRKGKPSSDLVVGLALSGGGYRAALVHAGVLAALDKSNLSPARLCTVSGGSIIGTFYAAGGSPISFRDAVVEGRLHVKREALRIQNVFAFRNRSQAQRKVLDRALFGEMTLQELVDRGGTHILVATTELSHGTAIGFGPTFYLERYMPMQAEKRQFTNRDAMRLVPQTACVKYSDDFTVTTTVSDLVTASGAFPGAFSPWRIKREPRRLIDTSFVLADGGIVDNSGFDLLIDAHRLSSGEASQFSTPVDGWQLDLALLSDASAVFPEDYSEGIISDFSRAMDIVYRNVRSGNDDTSIQEPTTVLLSPEFEFHRLRTSETIDYKLPLSLRGPFGLMPGNVKRLIMQQDPLMLFLIDLLSEGDSYTTERATQLRSSNYSRTAVNEFIDSLGHDLKWDLDLCLGVFAKTSTLTEKFRPDQANALFRLGVYLVLLEQPVLQTNVRELTIEKREQKKTWLAIKLAAQRICKRDFAVDPLIDLRLAAWFEPKALADNVSPAISIEDARAVVAAHWFAHVIHRSTNPADNENPRATLLDECLMGWSDSDREREIDEITRKILTEAGYDPSGLQAFLRGALEYLGTQSAHREVPARLKSKPKVNESSVAP